MTDNKDPKKKANTKWLALINIPIQMGIIVFLFAKIANSSDFLAADDDFLPII